jgi:hypothetical protein
MYYLYTGYKFRPTNDNAYLRVTQDDDDETGDIELGRATGAGTASSGGPVQTVSAVHRSAATAAAVEAELTGSDSNAPKAAASSKVVITTDDEEFGLDEELDEAAGARAGSAAVKPKPGGARATATAEEEGWEEDDFDGLDDEDDKKDLLPSSR